MKPINSRTYKQTLGLTGAFNVELKSKLAVTSAISHGWSAEIVFEAVDQTRQGDLFTRPRVILTALEPVKERVICML